MASIEARVIKVVAEATKADESKIKPETSFVDDLKLDSMDVVELIIAMEDEFSGDGDKTLEIADEDAQKFNVVKDVVEYLKSHGVAD